MQLSLGSLRLGDLALFLSLFLRRFGYLLIHCAAEIAQTDSGAFEHTAVVAADETAPQAMQVHVRRVRLHAFVTSSRSTSACTLRRLWLHTGACA